MVASRIEQRIWKRLNNCTYCDQGVGAYDQAERAVRMAFEDVRESFARSSREIVKNNS